MVNNSELKEKIVVNPNGMNLSKLWEKIDTLLGEGNWLYEGNPELWVNPDIRVRSPKDKELLKKEGLCA